MNGGGNGGKPVSCAAAVLRGAKRINVVGTSGAGKTTFSRQLAALLELPCHEMDRLYWRAGKTYSSNRARHLALMAGERSFEMVRIGSAAEAEEILGALAGEPLGC